MSRWINESGESNIERLIEETLKSERISAETIQDFASDLEPEDRVQYLNGLLSFEGMHLKYAKQFEANVPREINNIMDLTVIELKDLRERLHTDPLTGVRSRAFIERKDREPKEKYAVLMMDLDKFKRWNDLYGHDVGDIALRVLGSILRDAVRRTEGYIARYGGEEFYVELNQTDAGNAAKAAERIRANVEKYGMQRVGAALMENGQEAVYKKMLADGITMTISIGVAEELQGKMPEEARKRADLALSNAKSNGRNQVIVYKDGMTMP